MKRLAFARLLQFASQALPIGGYSHSQGLESAIEQGVVADEPTAARWILNVLDYSILTFDIPMLMSMSDAWAVVMRTRSDARPPPARVTQMLRDLNEEYLATRESAELRAAAVQMGYSLRELLAVLPGFPVASLSVLRSLAEPALPCAWSAAAAGWRLDAHDSAMAYAWSWAENQVLVALKTVPLGQSAGQRILLEIGTHLARALDRKQLIASEQRSNFTPALAILCARHETQYSRLFRS